MNLQDLEKMINTYLNDVQAFGEVDEYDRNLLVDLENLFDRENCHQGLQCLRHYRYDVDPDTKQFSKTPLHDIYSHGADAFKYLGLVVNEPRKSVVKRVVSQPAGSWMG